MLTDLIAPVLVAAVMLTALAKKTGISSAFGEGAREGLQTAVEIFPTLLLLITAVTMFTGSGCSGLLSQLFAPAAEKLGFPSECIPLMIIRPVSGSGSLAVLEGILDENPPDSFAARTACVMMSAAETTLYTITLLFSSVKVKPRASFFAASFIADITCFVFAPLFVRLTFGT